MNYRKKYLSACIAALLGGASPAFAADAPSLGTASSFAVLGSSTVTCIGAPTIITGDVGVSPGSAVTGFPPCTVVGGAIHAADAVAAQAQADATTAYNNLVGRTCPQANNLTGQDLGGLTLKPGVYCFDSSAGLTGTLNLTGAGPWIFQIVSTLTTASSSSVLVNGGSADCSPGVFWAVGSSATLGTGTQFQGVIIAVASDTLTTSATVSGGVFALNGAVTLDTNLVNACSSGGTAKQKCNQGVGNGPEFCDPGNSNQGNPFRSNDELRGTVPVPGSNPGVPGNPGRKGGNNLPPL